MPCPISNSDGFRFCFFGDVLISSVRSLRSFFMYWSEGVEGAGSLAAGDLSKGNQHCSASQTGKASQLLLSIRLKVGNGGNIVIGIIREWREQWQNPRFPLF